MEISTVQLWSSSILQTSLGYDNLFLDNLSKFLISLSKDKLNQVSVSNIGGWHSKYDLAQEQNPENQAVHSEVNKIITWLYSRTDNTYFERNRLIMNSWANINTNGTFQTFHNHADWALSAVFYVNVPSNMTKLEHGSITFQDFSSRSMNPNFADLAHVFGAKERRVKVSSSDLLIFPSHLPHSVLPTFVEEPRITIAFNFKAIPST